VASSPTSFAVSSTDPHEAAWREVERAVLGSPGTLAAEARRAIARGEDPPQLVALLEKVRKHAYRITDDDVAGLDDDTVIEAVLAAALGEADRRRRAALEAIG
jgi:hypothetical protein